MGAARRSPTKKPDRVFWKIGGKLDSPSVDHEQILRHVRFREVCETLHKYEGYIKWQFGAFISMMDQVQKTPNDAQRHMDLFKDIYERNKSDLSLDVYYRSTMETETGLFGRQVLKVCSDQCGGSREAMEHWCSYLSTILLMGLAAHVAYTAITEDSIEDFRGKWGARLRNIKIRMRDALRQCKDN